ncbi:MULTISPECIES: TonB-dependent hemoglobin/transferrin/lactoferrin family receptor [unclassified Salinivibrio]|uniref:TonB-dependent hemoglobin/transferrin/lactoferrin family receptor n=1 Tax=unclassified Salinivibrio TaxID=2636825 RepID=UPI00128DCAEC|nr:MULTISPECIES: TonB-dependent hemoglobin/transferrin/lactoferrin family receptor [unclassified Salinivibrio]MPS31695.1 TonB-dependent hemoglobin/transferrin/lactoferrin family receptor [Salinivibrio sp. VYel7]MPX90266.1 TonB-dependent hemoglobin/transferrin/lactoferrin family receptor [Salinivibrio sp. VYel1]MPX93090.1 TonB-dependent hemoglobin/transferrin/lactoferrin family receptor [Salinivibrio sp. VYel9]MPX95226.1 TonB-dependent hemoglobin/transferrin/lactoferrin family receptor [Salinivi
MKTRKDIWTVKHSHRVALAVGAVLSTMTVAPQAVAESASAASQSKEASSVETLSVYGSRMDTQKANAGVAVSTVSLEEIEKRQGSNVTDLIRHLPNVSVLGGGRDAAQSVSIRGLSSDNGRVIQLVDGARQNFSVGHRSSLFIDPELLSSVEVVRGPSSTLWGSGALGGVFAQNTKSASDFLSGTETLGGYVKQGFHSNDNASRTSGAVFGRTETVDWLVQSYYHDSDDSQLGNGKTLSYSADREKGGFAKLVFTPSLDHQWSFIARQGKRDAMVPSNPTTTSSPLVYRQVDDQSLSLTYNYNPSQSWVDLDTRLYWNDTEVNEHRVDKGEFDNNQMQTLGLSLSNRSTLEALTLTTGLDAYQDNFETVRDASGSMFGRPDDQDAEAQSVGLFSQVDVPLGQAWQWQAGVRFDAYDAKDKRPESTIGNHDNTAWSPSTALTWNATEQLALTASYREAFRAPSLEEMYASGTHYPGNQFVPNPDLRPEESANKELNITYTFAPSTYVDQGYIDARVFRNDVDNFINQSVKRTKGTTVKENLPEAKLEGIEISLHHQLGGFTNNLSYSQTEGKNKHDGSYLDNIPAHKWVAETDYALATLPVSVGGRVSHYADQDDTNNANTYDGYTLWDLYASYSPNGAWDGVKFDLAIDNLTDEQYTQAWAQTASPGRDIKFNVRYQF